jgi:hypothetical protein
LQKDTEQILEMMTLRQAAGVPTTDQELTEDTIQFMKVSILTLLLLSQSQQEMDVQELIIQTEVLLAILVVQLAQTDLSAEIRLTEPLTINSLNLIIMKMTKEKVLLLHD